MQRRFRYYRPRRYHASRGVQPMLQGLLLLIAAAFILSLVSFSTSFIAFGGFVLNFFPYIVFWIILIILAVLVISLLVRSMRVGTATIRPTSRSLDFKYAHMVAVEHPSIDVILADYRRLPYVKKKYLMTANEGRFFRTLQTVVNDSYYIVPQVTLSRLVGVNEHELLQKTYRNKINHKSVDFVLFTKPYFEPALIIEVDDRRHHQSKGLVRDQFVNSVARKAGIQIVHIKASPAYDRIQIQNEITNSGFQLSPRVNSYQ